jgi:tetratricopeptide (TPR) repeat protein
MDVYHRAGEFDAVYGRPLADLEGEWLAFLEARTISELDLERERVRFERRSIFRRPCAHRIAELSAQANLDRRSAKNEEAIEGIREICRLEANEPAHRLRLARAQAAADLEADAFTTLDEASALEKLTRSQVAAIEELRGDIALAAKDYESAVRAYEKARALPLREGRLRGIDIKLTGARLGQQGDDALAKRILDYFGPFDALTLDWVKRLRGLENARVLAGQDARELGAMGHYLVARQLLNAALLSEARSHIDLALSLPPEAWYSVELERAAWFMGVQLRMGAVQLIDAHEKGLATAGGHQLALRWWRERIEFARSYTP